MLIYAGPTSWGGWLCKSGGHFPLTGTVMQVQVQERPPERDNPSNPAGNERLECKLACKVRDFKAFFFFVFAALDSVAGYSRAKRVGLVILRVCACARVSSEFSTRKEGRVIRCQRRREQIISYIPAVRSEFFDQRITRRRLERDSRTLRLGTPSSLFSFCLS